MTTSRLREALVVPELIAIDVLLEPDERIHDLAIAYNRGFLRRVPAPRGFELGASRMPHVTVVQRYVRADDLDAALDAVAPVVAVADRAVFELSTDGAPRASRPAADGVVTVVWWMTLGRELLALQSSLLDALEPFTAEGGDERAFVRTDDEPEISDSTIRYVERFVPEHSGRNFSPHLTLGRAALEDVEALTGDAATPILFTSAALAVYQLGDHGTARRRLARWAH